MKETIHPQYYPNAKVKCVCGNEWTVGSTAEELHTSICSNCHPFYTGAEKIVDTRGRVDRFKRTMEKASTRAASATVKKPRSAKNSK